MVESNQRKLKLNQEAVSQPEDIELTRQRVFLSTDGLEDTCNTNCNLDKLENCGTN